MSEIRFRFWLNISHPSSFFSHRKSACERRSSWSSGLKEIYLRKGNRQKWLGFTKEHKKWTVEQWKNVLWSDELKFEIFSSKRRQYVRGGVGEQMKDVCLKPTDKHGGGSIMVFGCLTANAEGNMVRIDGITNMLRNIDKFWSTMKSPRVSL